MLLDNFVYRTDRLDIADPVGLTKVGNMLATLDSSKQLPCNLAAMIGCFSAVVWLLILGSFCGCWTLSVLVVKIRNFENFEQNAFFCLFSILFGKREYKFIHY